MYSFHDEIYAMQCNDPHVYSSCLYEMDRVLLHIPVKVKYKRLAKKAFQENNDSFVSESVSLAEEQRATS